MTDDQIVRFELPKNIVVDDPVFTKRVMTHDKLYRIKSKAESPPAASVGGRESPAQPVPSGQTLLVSLYSPLLQEAGEEDDHVA